MYAFIGLMDPYSPEIAPLDIGLNDLIEELSLDWKTNVIAQLDKVSSLPCLLL